MRQLIGEEEEEEGREDQQWVEEEGGSREEEGKCHKEKEDNKEEEEELTMIQMQPLQMQMVLKGVKRHYTMDVTGRQISETF